ncbi:molecular chaperone [Providencia alcalifaciens]|uniref:Fimbria/pilus periplasmic chaperone n=1 Tax=Providencia alcalifaciens TaxID=126385 RepID=A0AAW9VDC3_9GAMM|nr:molecular chaperone [Providencia alcalifaciens]EKT63391.1 fimbrial chaperone protein [Providencia alcalifaciens Dmel2]ETT09122.1 PapD pilus/flagellar-assembly chaperone N-terminal domain protein [Providencia alcalifaciens F90-2004]EUC97427.1 PapD pilus/flagellar-assembly chaperone N-terminal domain protein [Providencia alcalifaciens PAL-2]MTB32001.1 fimbria/pilus periplasmic chaperone [Providencia alcalifaciens]MTC31210.1 fimbria/pilus periplasmic chaperone [Providencia alcalifaciens]
MKTIISVCIMLIALSQSAYAGVIIGGTRVIYPEGNKDVSISVENPDKVPYLIQSWIENANEGKQTDFTITPPLFRLNQEKTNALRIFLTQNTLPNDKESLFWLNIKTIPATEKKTENSLKIAFKTQMKLIYRPSAISNVDFAEEQKKLTWSKVGTSITVKNPTPYYMNFQSISFNGKKAENISYVAPFSTKSFTIHSPELHGTIKWEVINDYGSANHPAEIKI